MRALSEDDGGMKITADKERVLRTLQANRVKHIEFFNQALLAYHQEVMKTLKTKLDEVKKVAVEDLGNLYISLHVPTCNVDAYDTAIEMMNYHTLDTVVLNAYQVQSFIQDKWEWTKSFEQNTMSYLGGRHR